MTAAILCIDDARQRTAHRQAGERIPWDAVPVPSRCQVTAFPQAEITDRHGAARLKDCVSPACKLGDAALTIALLPVVMSLHWFFLGCAVLLNVNNMTRGPGDGKNTDD